MENSNNSILQEELEFELSKGVKDSSGTCHKSASMRLATGADELSVETDMSFQRVKHIPYMRNLHLFTKVLIKLGPYRNSTDRKEITIDTLLSLPVDDLRKISGVYREFNFGISRMDGDMSYDVESLYAEIAIIAYYFHWSYSEITRFSTLERKKWCNEILKLQRTVKNKRK